VLTSGSVWAAFIVKIGARGTLSICTEVQQYPEPTFWTVTPAKQSQSSGDRAYLCLSSGREP